MKDNQEANYSENPINTFKYKAKIGNDVIAFREIEGLNSGDESNENKEAKSEGNSTPQEVGLRDIPTISLKRGIFEKSVEIYDWLNNMHTDDLSKNDILISMLDNNNDTVKTWTVTNAFPTKYEGPVLDVNSKDVPFLSLDVTGDEVINDFIRTKR